MSRCAADVFDGCLGGHGVEGDDLGDLVAAVFAGDVVDDLAAAVHAEVDVDIRHGDALGVEEALEEEFVLQRIDVGDLHDVGDERTGGRASTRAYRNIVLACVLDKVPDDHEIAGKLHLFDDVELAVETGVVLGDGLLEQAAFAQMGDGGVEAHLQAFAADLLEVAVERLAFGDDEVGERIIDLGHLEVAAVDELHGASADLGVLGEGAQHLLGALDVELLRVELEPLRVVHAACGLHAEKNLVGAGVVGGYVVAVVGGDEWDVEVALHLEERVADGFIRSEAVVLNFQEVVALAEEIFVEACGAFGLVILPVHQVLVHLAGEAAGEADETF